MMDSQMNQKINLKEKVCRVVDNGLFVSFARHIAPAFKKLQYYCPWQTYAPTTASLMAGDGFEEMERIEFVMEDIDKVDLWVFLDMYHADLQNFLVKRGARVWGARSGEDLELYRWEFKQTLKKLGLPVQPCELVIGMDELREVLRQKKDVHIKSSFTRGDFETFRHHSYALSEPKLDEIEHVLGPTKVDYEFVVEDDIPDAVEVGYDGFTVDGSFPNHAMMAYEIKDVGMIGTTKPYDQLANPVRFVNSKLSPLLKSHQYRGFLCTEIRYSKEKKPFLIDPCCRLGSPSNELLQVLFNDWPLVLWYGAEGTVYNPKPRFEFGVLAVLHCEFAVENYEAIYYPKEIDPFVKLRFHSRVDGTNYTVPQPIGLASPGCVLGVGNTLLEAVRQCKEHASQVKGYQIDVSLDSIDEALKVIAKGEKMGIKFTDKPLPTAEQLSKV